MNFATLAYAGFLLAVVVIHWLLPRSILRRWFLILASLAFFGTWNWVYVPGFVALVMANFGLGLLAARPGRERLAVRLAILANLGILCVFKYADWVVGSAAAERAGKGNPALMTAALASATFVTTPVARPGACP